MSARYVKVPIGDRIIFPKTCPFTRSQNPRSTVLISRSETQMILPVPFIHHFTLGQEARMAFPAVTWFAVVARVLSWLPPILFVSGLIIGGKIIESRETLGVRLMFGGLVTAWLSKALKFIWVRRVRIIGFGMSSLHVRFGCEKYADEFCRLNDYGCHSKPFPKVARPITVNDIR